MQTHYIHLITRNLSPAAERKLLESMDVDAYAITSRTSGPGAWVKVATSDGLQLVRTARILDLSDADYTLRLNATPREGCVNNDLADTFDAMEAHAAEAEERLNDYRYEADEIR
jgi:hypothetical protein